MIITIYDYLNNNLYPARMLSSVDFPAPEGPRIAVSSPDLNCPLSPLKIAFDSVNLTESQVAFYT